MTAEATEALAAALEETKISGAYAARIEHQLAARGYEIVRTKTARGDRQITGYPCTCWPGGHGCLEHPFGPVREVNP